MRKVSLFIATSLDGYIADTRGGVNWIAGQSSDIENLDTYSGMTTYIFTHRQEKSTDEIKFTNENPVTLINKLKQQEGKDIWICGGANLIQQLVENELVDKYYISIIPTLLGKGLRLFGASLQEQKLKLINTRNYNGIVDVVYERR